MRQETDVVYSIGSVSCHSGTETDDTDFMDQSQRVGQHAEWKQEGEADKGKHDVKSVKARQEKVVQRMDGCRGEDRVKDSRPDARVFNDRAAGNEADWSAVVLSW